MKLKLLLVFVFQLLLWDCKTSSISKQDLIAENNSLKERLLQYEIMDTSKIDAVVEVSNMNAVYRGVFNPIKISMSKAIKIEASGPGLRKLDDDGNYSLVPTSGNEVIIEVKGFMIDNDTVVKRKRLRIKNIGKLTGTINGSGCRKCEVLITKKEFSGAIIESKLYDMLFDWKISVFSFKVKFPGRKTIKITGNRIPAELDSIIGDLNPADRVQIFDIQVTSSARASFAGSSPIMIRIIKD